jgi:hypothetical protein
VGSPTGTPGRTAKHPKPLFRREEGRPGRHDITTLEAMVEHMVNLNLDSATGSLVPDRAASQGRRGGSISPLHQSLVLGEVRAQIGMEQGWAKGILELHK